MLWFLQGSNQGHMDFQSIALPTELRNQHSHCYFEWCKNIFFILTVQVILKIP